MTEAVEIHGPVRSEADAPQQDDENKEYAQRIQIVHDGSSQNDDRRLYAPVRIINGSIVEDTAEYENKNRGSSVRNQQRQPDRRIDKVV